MAITKDIRTDLALEARELWSKNAANTSSLPGVRAVQDRVEGFLRTTVEVLDETGAQALGKPVGRYVTIELDALCRREENAFARAASLLANTLRSLLADSRNLLVAGLGNRAITPDAVGPLTADCILATRHLRRRLPETFGSFGEVAVLRTGVLGTTGLESAELVEAVVRGIRPDCVVAVDALASCQPERLCRTVQIADTGIIPGSGVGNRRAALNRETLGIPVVAIGVPTVVDAPTMLAHCSPGDTSQGERNGLGSLMVTPRDIDRSVHDISRLLGYSINLAAHPGLRISDVDMLL